MNTKVFYQAIKARRTNNMVYAIHISSGEWVNTQDKANEAFLNFYKNLFTKKNLVGLQSTKYSKLGLEDDL